MNSSGQQYEVFSGHLTRGADYANIDVDLKPYANKDIAITCAVSSPENNESTTEDQADSGVVWENLQVYGTEPLFANSAPLDVRGKYNVLLVMFDSLRADHLEPYGASEMKTPYLSRFAQTGVTFENMWANASWTRPSTASMLTSLLPWSHNVRGGTDGLPANVTTLAAEIKRIGYVTMEVTTSPQTYPSFGFGKGFDVVHPIHTFWRELSKVPIPEERAQLMWDTHIEPFLESRNGAPFFIFLHELDPHHPYDPPPPFDRMYGDTYRGNMKEDQREWRTLVERGVIRLEKSDIDFLHHRYQGKVSFVDAYFAALMGFLESAGLIRNTLVVLVSDHGEEFLEHGQITHGKSLFEEVLRVPLILRLDGILPAGARPQAHAQHIDIAPTILDLLGGRIPAEMQGRSLLPYIYQPEIRASQIPIVASHALGYVPFSEDAIVFGDWKLIRRTPLHSTSPSIEYRLFDLENDSRELQDLWPKENITGKVLQQMLLRGIRLHDSPRSAAPIPTKELNQDTIEQLKALGYLN